MDGGQRVLAGRKKLHNPLYLREKLGVRLNRAEPRFIDISERSLARIYPSADFLPDAAPDVHGEVADILIRHAKFNRDHEHIVGRQIRFLDREGRLDFKICISNLQVDELIDFSKQLAVAYGWSDTNVTKLGVTLIDSNTGFANSTSINHQGKTGFANSTSINHQGKTGFANSTSINHQGKTGFANSTSINHQGNTDFANSTSINHQGNTGFANSTSINHQGKTISIAILINIFQLWSSLGPDEIIDRIKLI